MRKLIIVAVAVAFLVSMGAFAAEMTGATKPAKHATRAHQVVGEVVSASGGSIVVKESVKGGAEGKEATFSTNDKTKVTAAGKPGKLEDLKAGDAVTIKYMKEGDQMVAEHIILAPAKTMRTKPSTASETAPKTKSAPTTK